MINRGRRHIISSDTAKARRGKERSPRPVSDAQKRLTTDGLRKGRRRTKRAHPGDEKNVQCDLLVKRRKTVRKYGKERCGGD